jgi:hypothetical protein
VHSFRAAPPGTEVLGAVETALVTHRAFGDSGYIRDQLAVAYRRRLHKLGSALPEAERLASGLDATPPARQRQLLGDTVLGCAVQHAMRQLHLGDDYGLPLPQCTALFQGAHEHLRAGLPGEPLVAHLPPMARLHEERERRATGNEDTEADTYIWHAWQEDTPYARAFLAVMEDNYGAPLATPTPQERTLLRRGLRLLETLLPRLTAGALSHVQLIALFPKLGTWRGKASSSQFRVNGSVFLNQELIGNPWWLAEHMLHEALHQKLYDFRRGHSLLAPDYAREDGAKICSLWNAPDDGNNHYWDAHRALAAFHVYVHLTLLCLLAEQQEAALAPRYDPIGQHMLDKQLAPSTQAQQQNWPQARQRVLQALWPLAQDDATMKRRGYPQAQALIAQMVQLSSRQLAALGALG